MSAGLPIASPLADATGPTRDFFRLYLHHAGKSEIPPTYHLWAAITLLAAAIGDGAWVAKFADSPIRPNLYTMLIGPSGIGKDHAVETTTKFANGIDAINLYNGELTAAFLITLLAQNASHVDDQTIEGARLFLTTPELAMSVGEGEHARALIKHMTGLYGGGNVPFKKGTLTSGLIVAKRPCINWLAGTTADWLVDAIPANAIKGGFLGRFVCIPEDYNLDLRVPKPLFPANRQFIVDYLRARVEALTKPTGQMTLSVDAAEIEDYWYRQRPSPSDPLMVPTWRRQHDLVYKLSIILAKARDELTARIEKVDWVQAMKLAAVSERGAYFVLAAVAQTPETAKIDQIAETIQRSRYIQHASLMRRMRLSAKEAESAIRTLIGRGQVRIEQRHGNRGPAGRFYFWVEESMPDEPPIADLMDPDQPLPDDLADITPEEEI